MSWCSIYLVKEIQKQLKTLINLYVLEANDWVHKWNAFDLKEKHLCPILGLDISHGCSHFFFLRKKSWLEFSKLKRQSIKLINYRVCLLNYVLNFDCAIYLQRISKYSSDQLFKKKFDRFSNNRHSYLFIYLFFDNNFSTTIYQLLFFFSLRNVVYNY